MASAELEKVVGLLRKRPLRAASVAEQRADLEAKAFPPTDAATVLLLDVDGIEGEWVTVAASDPHRRLLYLHGGGYVIGSPRTHRRLCENLAQAAGVSVLNLDYRLAPEHPFPAGLEDALSALQYVHGHGPAGEGEAAAVFVGGDSAGGGLTLAVLLAARDRGLALPQAAVAISAWTDLAVTGESIQTRAAVDPSITDLAVLKQMAAAYLGETKATDPLASPLYAEYEGLPPLLLQVGDAEVLLDDTTRVAERARAAGVEVVEEVWDDMFHVWHALAPMLPEGQAGIARAGEFLRQYG